LVRFQEFIAKNYRTPDVEGLRGKVIVSFVVEKDGSIVDVKVIKDLGYGTGAEAIRVLKLSPKWTPAMQDGKPVRVMYSLPITIRSTR
jgi:protein TonB